MLTLVLAEAELELIPEEIISHPSIVSYSKKLNKKARNLILDSSFHHPALKKLPEGNRRGRPDIVHIFLLVSLDSIANKRNHLRVIVHTRNNQAIYVNPETRIMRNYTRFIGLMEQLFEKKVIVSGEDEEKILLELKEDVTIEKILEEEKCDAVITFSSKGEKVNLFDYLRKLKENNCKDLLCIIGGFPHGDFHFNVKRYSKDVISIYDEPLSAWVVGSEIIVNYENIFINNL